MPNRQTPLFFAHPEQLTEQLAPNHAPQAQRQPLNPYLSARQVAKRWKTLNHPQAEQQLLDPQTQEQMASYAKNIENFIGTIKMPVGIAGPLRIRGSYAQGDLFIPLATTEAALVASYNRGALLISEAGGCSALLLSEGVSRTPAFVFENLSQAGAFAAWATTRQEQFAAIAEATSSHLQMQDFRLSIEGNHVYLIFEFRTGDASGQNMVTIATNAILNEIKATTPIPFQYAFLDGNLSSDKKASAQTMGHVRGKKVTAEVHIPAELLKKRLHTNAETIEEFWRISAVSNAQSGTLGIQGHYANALAAFYIATGQDAACVAESAIGVTRFEAKADGGLYASVTLPNLMVGSVGGGTGLPSQHACLELMGLAGSGHARALAEVCAGLCLAGELSITGAFCAGHFSRAHHKLAR